MLDKSLHFLFQFFDVTNKPEGICIDRDKVYVTQYISSSLNVYSTQGIYLQSVGKFGNKELEFYWPRGVGISTVNNLIYICDWFNNRIQCLNLDLTFNTIISGVNTPRDIKLTYEHIIVLTGGNPCICYYNYSHQLTTEIITQGWGNQVIESWHFCLDKELNIVMTDYSANRVLLFSNRGRLLHTFGKRGKGRGEFISPTGIALDFENNIIVTSQNPGHCIQLF